MVWHLVDVKREWGIKKFKTSIHTIVARYDKSIKVLLENEVMKY